MTATEPRHYFSALLDSKVDEDSKTIRKVSLISEGEARGHRSYDGEDDEVGKPVFVDATTLQEVFDYCRAVGSVKVKVDHGSGVFSTVGYVDAFALEPSRVTGNLHIYDSEPESPRIFEIAAKNPTHLGISLEFIGDDEDTPTKCLARCSEVMTAALVSDPAANRSLFFAAKTIYAKNVNSLASNPKLATTQNITMAKSKKELAEGTDKPADSETAVDPTPQNSAPSLDEMYSAFTTHLEEFSKFKKAYEDANKPDETEINAEGTDGEKPPTVDPSVEPAAKGEKDMGADEPDGDEKKKEMSRIVDESVNKAVKTFAAQLGVKLPAAGAKQGEPSQKTFAELVESETKRFDGDKDKAMLFCIKTYKKEYADSRNVKTS